MLFFVERRNIMKSVIVKLGIIAIVALCSASSYATDVNIATMSNGGSAYIVSGYSSYAWDMSGLFDGSDALTHNRIAADKGTVVRTWHQYVTLNKVRVNLGGYHSSQAQYLAIYTRNQSTGTWDKQYEQNISGYGWYEHQFSAPVTTDALKIVATVTNYNGINEIEAYSPSAITPVNPINLALQENGGTLETTSLRGGDKWASMDGDDMSYSYYYNGGSITRIWDTPVAVSEIHVVAGRHGSIEGAFQGVDYDLEIWDLNTNSWKKVQDGSAGFDPFYDGSQFHLHLGTSVRFDNPIMTTKVRISNIQNGSYNAGRIKELVVYGYIPEPATVGIITLGAFGFLRKK